MNVGQSPPPTLPNQQPTNQVKKNNSNGEIGFKMGEILLIYFPYRTIVLS